MARSTKSEGLFSAKDIVEKLQNVQIYPATERVEINDKFTKVAFKRDFNPNETYGIIEKKSPVRGKTQNPVVTEYSFSSDDITVSLDEFTRAVLGVCISGEGIFTLLSISFSAL